MLDFRPDLDPRTPGLLTYVNALMPTERGYITYTGECDYGPPYTYTLAANEVWPNVCFATRWQSQAGGIVIVGTNQKLNVLNGSSGYIDVSKGGGYALGAVTYQLGEDAYGAFDICAYGDVIIACNISAPSQKRTALDLTGATLFSDLGSFTAAPQGNTCCVAANFVFIGDVGNWSTVTGSSDILAWSAIGDHTDWRVNPQVTQCSYAQFVDTPGRITVVRAFRDGIVVFKASSMYFGRYVGAGPNSPIWDFERISDKVGCVGHRSIVNIDNALVFCGQYDLFIYDGTRPRSITDGIHEFLFNLELFSGASLDSGKIPVQLAHHKGRNCVWFSGYTTTLVWNYRFDRWGILTNQHTAQPIPCQSDIDDLRTETVSSVTAGVPTLTEGNNFTNLNTLQIISGVTKNYNNPAVLANSFLTTGWFGQPDRLHTLQRVNPIFTLRPNSRTNVDLTVYGSQTPSTGTTLGSVKLNSNFRFDTLGPTPDGTMAGSTQNFFMLRMDCHQDIHEIVDLVPKFVPAGER